MQFYQHGYGCFKISNSVHVLYLRHEFHDLFIHRVAEALILGTMMVGQATAFAPNYNKAIIASARIFNLLDRKPLIDSSGAAGLKLVSMLLL